MFEHQKPEVFPEVFQRFLILGFRSTFFVYFRCKVTCTVHTITTLWIQKEWERDRPRNKTPSKHFQNTFKFQISSYTCASIQEKSYCVLISSLGLWQTHLTDLSITLAPKAPPRYLSLISVALKIFLWNQYRSQSHLSVLAKIFVVWLALLLKDGTTAP